VSPSNVRKRSIPATSGNEPRTYRNFRGRRPESRAICTGISAHPRVASRAGELNEAVLSLCQGVKYEIGCALSAMSGGEYRTLGFDAVRRN